jgi:hypothetical protein
MIMKGRLFRCENQCVGEGERRQQWGEYYRNTAKEGC